jgi:hypothetical protein
MISTHGVRRKPKTVRGQMGYRGSIDGQTRLMLMASKPKAALVDKVLHQQAVFVRAGGFILDRQSRADLKALNRVQLAESFFALGGRE